MPITKTQRKQRQNFLGSSDLPAIMGFSRFSNAYDVWLEKTGKKIEDAVEKDYQTAGQLFEESVLTWFNTTINQARIRRNVERRVPDMPIKVHIDAVLQDNGEPVESKTEGLYRPLIEPWGDAGTDEVPEYTCIQAHCHLMATDTEICHVPTFLGGRGFQYFFVRRDNKLIKLIQEQAVHFWEDHVLKDIPPEDCLPRLENIKAIRRIEGDPVALPDDVVAEFIKAKEACKRAETYKDEMKAKILALLGGNEIGECADYFITNFRQSKTFLNTKALAEKHPDIAKTFTKITSFAVMREKAKA